MTSPANKTSSTSSALTPSNTTVASPFPSLTNASHFLSLKLTNTNYLYWKTQLLPYLRGQRLIGFVDGSNPCPPATKLENDVQVANPDFEMWVSQDQLLMSLLIASLSEEILPLIVGLATSRDIWNTLEAALASASHTRILQLHMQLQNIKQGDLTATQFLYKAKALSDELSAAGRPLSLQDFNLYVFKGLSSDFRDLVTTLATRPSPLPYSELHSLILSHEFMNMNCFTSLSVSDNTISPPQAHVAHRQSSSSSHGRDHNGNGRGRSRGRDRGRGYSNNSNGGRNSNGGSGSFYSRGDSRGDARHFSHESRSYHSTGSRQRCQICNGTNHIALSCNQRYNHTMPPSAHLASYNSAPAPYADWFPDTGATHHATPDLAAFSHHEDYHGTDQLQVGNGHQENAVPRGD